MNNLDAFTNRLRKNQRHWRKWARRRGISCYRIYDRDIPEFPLAIDWYEGHLHAQLFARKGIEEPSESEERAIADALSSVMEVPADRLAFKTRRRQRGLTQYQKTGRQGRPMIVQEAGLRFEVDLHSYLDTGLFLDHRITRSMVREQAAGKRFLNLFAYTGSFSVYAAAGGAEASLTVDLSNTYQEWSQRNLQLNGFGYPRHRLQRADVFEFLIQAERKRERFDLIVLDPPSFSNSKRMQEVLDVQRDHARLIEGCMALLNHGGKLIFSNNRRRFRLDESIEQTFDCSEITRQTLPEDFHRHPAHRCWRLKG